MLKENFKLIDKKELTHDVFELVFESQNEEKVEAWQFITFKLSAWMRAYSISDNNWKRYSFIIKRLENWKWWSKEICDLELWNEIFWMWPVWHFVLKENDKDKLFLWTWTGFAPLYFQIKKAIESWDKTQKLFIFWIREEKDLFYLDELEKFKKLDKNFDYKIYLSREEKKPYKKWYITDFLTKENIENYEDFYICWSPAMVTDAKEKLQILWKKEVFFEMY